MTERFGRQKIFDQREFTSKSVLIHFMGIAGSGASACAAIAKAQGLQVSGCDINPTQEFAQGLKKIQIQKGHDPTHLQGVDILAITPAISSIDPNNPELLEAKNRKIKILTWQQFLGKYLVKNHFVVAVCGTHGKSTTTAMIGQILEDGGLDPTIILGANVKKWGGNFREPTNVTLGTQGEAWRTPESSRLKNKKTDSGLARMTHKELPIFVVEADEFNDNYLSLTPDISVVTNIEYDHPEYFKDFLSYQRSFQNFLLKTKNMIVASLEDPVVQEVLAFHLRGVHTNPEDHFKPVVDYSKNLIDFPLKVIGEHNILNASAAYAVGIVLGINPKFIKKSLEDFEGVGRRQEFLGEANGAKIFSDFGHHPTEIKATIDAFKQKFDDRRIFVIFEPHMFTRTKVLFNEFVETFKNLPVDSVVILDIYPSREVDFGLVSSKDLVKAIDKDSIKYGESNGAIINELINKLTKNDLVIFMGAGDIDKIAREIVNSNL